MIVLRGEDGSMDVFAIGELIERDTTVGMLESAKIVVAQGDGE